MKKVNLLILTIFLVSSVSMVYAENCPIQDRQQINCQEPCKKLSQSCNEIPVHPDACKSDYFLCTNKDKQTVFAEIGLSETQICTASKIQDKYALETLSINERIECENAALNQLKSNCAKNKDIRKQKRIIKDLKSERKKICKCYEDQFKSILSDDQKRAYNRVKK